jgi:hypothetical protein
MLLRFNAADIAIVAAYIVIVVVHQLLSHACNIAVAKLPSLYFSRLIVVVVVAASAAATSKF